ncbi:TRAP transporter solute receptor, unknown substrate 3 [Geomicrobium sp. JCM 19037]|uniref:TRAP transporter substrate-binding protein n=1 Tax=Geomicrobium sp. JCM 19037 TaxID=1460634 RepID=UPI00045F1AC4|nr:TRAP transporter substrate-binding protein [Geomicrobium sp. JCM 19037]GAK05531.1 TRAP transporter solute receptor, unknown substrate 3 [Geomicrobium sp. JCM 19037]
MFDVVQDFATLKSTKKGGIQVKGMKCNRLLAISSFASFVLLAGCQTAETSGETVNEVDLAFSSFMPGPHPQHTDVFYPFIEEVEEATDGRVTGTLYAGNALSKADHHYDLVVNGVADMSIALHGYTPGRFPVTGVTELPFMGENGTKGTEILWSLHEKYPEIEAEHEGARVGWLFKNDPAQIFTTDTPIHSPEDLKGLKIRTPSPAARDILEAYGAIPVSMPMGDVYEGMQRGVIDGALAPASVVTNFQLADVTGYITEGNFYTSSLFVVINPGTWMNCQLKIRTHSKKLWAKTWR